MLASVLLSLLAAMLLGALLIALGFRGKKLNNHPTCRDCGFDLENVYPAGVTCPECGAGLKRDRGIRIGQRRRRPIFIGLGLLFIALPAAPIGVAAFALLTGKDFNTYKPLGVLLWEGTRADLKNGKGIATELLARMLTGKLDATQEARIADLALARQENADLPWDEAWGDLIERAKLDGHLSEAQNERFLKNAVVPRLKARPSVVAGDPVPVSITCETRIGGGMQVMITLWQQSAKLDGNDLQRTERTDGRRTPFGWGSFVDNGPILQTFAAGSKNQRFFGLSSEQENVIAYHDRDDPPPGRHEVELVILAQGMNWNMSGNSSMLNIKPAADSPKARRWVLHAPLDVLSKGTPSFEHVAPDQELADKLAQRLRPANVMLQQIRPPNVTLQQAGIPDEMLSMSLSVEDLPVPVAFDVYYRERDGQPVKFSTLTSGTGGEGTFWGVRGQKAMRSVSGSVVNIAGNKVDLIFRPNLEVPLFTMDLTKIYDGEVVIKGVDVQKMDRNGMYSFTSSSKSTTTTSDDDTDGSKDGQAATADKPAEPQKKGWLARWLPF